MAMALLFFLLGGVQALLLRIQLGTPENTFLDPATYNHIFTMHGTTMMFLFVIPFLEAIANYMMPLLLGARDLPYPRLASLAFWTFTFGGMFLYASFRFGVAPDGGWFAYVPLTGKEYSPGINMDWWECRRCNGIDPLLDKRGIFTRYPQAPIPAIPCIAPHEYELVGSDIRRRCEQNFAGDPERSRTGTDAERKRADDGQCEERLTAKRSQRNTYIRQQVHAASSSSPRSILPTRADPRNEAGVRSTWLRLQDYDSGIIVAGRAATSRVSRGFPQARLGRRPDSR